MSSKALKEFNDKLKSYKRKSKPSPIVQRKIKVLGSGRGDTDSALSGEISSQQALGLLGEDIMDGIADKLVTWYVTDMEKEDKAFEFKNPTEFRHNVSSFLRNWELGLAKLGIDISENRKSSGHDLYKAYRMYNTNATEGAEALVYKLDKEYKFLKERWVSETSPYYEPSHLSQGTIYDPPAGHTMPKNFAWIASVIHKQIPVRVVAPVDFRVLVRKIISERLANELGIQNGKEVNIEGEKRIEINAADVKSGITDAPLSATAREILALVQDGFYMVDECVHTPGRFELLLRPTGKKLINPADIYVPERMSYSELSSILSDKGIVIQGDNRITDIQDSIKLDKANLALYKARKFKAVVFASSALLALASWGLAKYSELV